MREDRRDGEGREKEGREKDRRRNFILCFVLFGTCSVDTSAA